MTRPANITVIETLCEYFKTEISSLSVIDEFPNSNEVLTYPCLSVITAGNPSYTNMMPFIISEGTIDEESVIKEVLYGVGQWDFNIQLDLWSEHKEQRGQYFDLVKDALNKQFLTAYADDNPLGLSLTLIDYHGIIARYDQTGYTYLDGENESQRNEWRIKIDLVCSFIDAKLKEVPIIKNSTLKTKIGDNVIIDDEKTNFDETINF